MKVHLSDQEYGALFILALGPAETVIDLQDIRGRAIAQCAERLVRLGVAVVFDQGSDKFAFSLTEPGCEAVLTDEALRWFRRECDATRATETQSAEIVRLQ